MLRRASLTVLALVLLPATVHAFDHHNDHDADDEGDGGGGCSSSSSHTSSGPRSGGTVTAVPPPASPKPAPSSGHKRVFVTSATFSGAIGGLDAADMYCQSAATAGGLAGTFQAWISYGSSNAFDRTSDVGPWYSTSDALVFASKADLGVPRSELLDEAGEYPQTVAGAWTGSDSLGAATNETCEGWTNATAGATATTGTAAKSDSSWGGASTSLSCDAKAPLICFQQ